MARLQQLYRDKIVAELQKSLVSLRAEREQAAQTVSRLRRQLANALVKRER